MLRAIRGAGLSNLQVAQLALCNVDIAHVQFANSWPKPDTNFKMTITLTLTITLILTVILTLAKMRRATHKLRSSTQRAQHL